MKISKTNHLTESEKEAVVQLEKGAFAAEGLVNHAYLSNEINAVKEAPCFYLLYKGGRLASFLTTFHPTSKEAEVLATTAVSERGKGYFTVLWNEVKKELRQIGIHQVLFVIEKNSNSGKAKLNAYPKAVWDHSEYHMAYRGGRTIEEEDAIRLELVTRDNMEQFAETAERIFEEKERNTSFYDSLVIEEQREGYLVYDHEKKVAVGNISYEGGQAYLYGIGVIEKERGKGYGRKMLNALISKVNAETKQIVLDVDSENPVAFSLYQKVGFEILNQVDYYRDILD